MKINTSRQCDGCTKCCEGWVSGTIYGYTMFPGKPCHFKIKGGCKIYDYRPNDPCKGYECEWKRGNFPLEWKPDKIGILITKGEHDNKVFYGIVEAGKKVDEAILAHFKNLQDSGKIENYAYIVNGKIQLVEKTHNK